MPRNTSTEDLGLLSGPLLAKWKNIMTRLLILMHIICPCVCSSCLLTHEMIANEVLSPTQKMAYFKKHWSTKLQDEVLESAESAVSMFRCLFIHCY